MNKLSSSAITIMIVFFLSISVYGQEAGQLRIPLSNQGQSGKLKVDINVGSITVIGSNVSEVIINYKSLERKVKDKSKGESTNKDGLKKISSGTLDLEAYEKNNTVVVESDSWGQGVDLDIQVPKNFDLHLEGYNNGDIKVSDIIGEIEAENYNGKITMYNISGSVVAETYNGAIVITFDKVTPDTPMAYSTYNGNVDLLFPASTKASFKMKSKQGEIYEGFGMEMVESKVTTKTERSKSGVYKVKVDNWVRGKINGGGPEITIQSYNGNILIRKGN